MAPAPPRGPAGRGPAPGRAGFVGPVKTARSVTIAECAALSANVYENQGDLGDWKRVPDISYTKDAASGFFGASYRRGSELVLALRGTSDKSDVATDLQMVPVRTGEHARQLMKVMHRMYEGQADSHASKFWQGNAWAIFSRTGTNAALKAHASRAPTDQGPAAGKLMRSAYEYAKANGLVLRCVTGHSLGGGLAQYASEQTGPGGDFADVPPTPGVSFNGPFMGDLKGMRPGQGGGIIIVNARLDPLSLATRLAQMSSHASPGCEFTLDTPKYGARAPTITDEELKNRELEVTYFRLWRIWFIKAAAHYHSIVHLADFLQKGNDPGPREIARLLPNAGK